MMEDVATGYIVCPGSEKGEKNDGAFPDPFWLMLLMALSSFGTSEISKAMVDAGIEKVKEIADYAKQSLPEELRNAADAE